MDARCRGSNQCMVCNRSGLCPAVDYDRSMDDDDEKHLSLNSFGVFSEDKILVFLIRLLCPTTLLNITYDD